MAKTMQRGRFGSIFYACMRLPPGALDQGEALTARPHPSSHYMTLRIRLFILYDLSPVKYMHVWPVALRLVASLFYPMLCP